MTTEQIKRKLIIAGISNLKEFGYEQVDKENILTDDIYSQFFRLMLNDNLGKTVGAVDIAIFELLKIVKR